MGFASSANNPAYFLIDCREFRRFFGGAVNGNHFPIDAFELAGRW